MGPVTIQIIGEGQIFPVIQFGSDTQFPDGLIYAIGKVCPWCDEPIAAGDRGSLIWEITAAEYGSWHQECLLRSFVGSVAHQLKTCHCFGGSVRDNEPPEGMTKRQQAKAAAEHYEAQQIHNQGAQIHARQ